MELENNNKLIKFTGNFEELLEFVKITPEVNSIKEGYLYGLEYLPNKTKIGRTSDARNRFSSYVGEFSQYARDLKLIDVVLLGPFLNLALLEKLLKSYLTVRYKTLKRTEWFDLSLNDLKNELNNSELQMYFKKHTKFDYDIDLMDEGILIRHLKYWLFHKKIDKIDVSGTEIGGLAKEIFLRYFIK